MTDVSRETNRRLIMNDNYDPLSCYKGWDLVMFFVFMAMFIAVPAVVFLTIRDLGRFYGWW